MKYHDLYGKLILACRDVKARKILRIVITIFFTIVMVLSILMIVIVNGPEHRGTIYFFGGIIVVSAASLFVLIFKYQKLEIEVYEYGLVFKQNKKERQLSFNEIEGVIKSSCKTPYDDILRASETKMYTIYPKQGENICVENDDITNYKGLVQAIDHAFFLHQTKNLNIDNLLLAKISFGKHLKLENGQFIYKNGEKIVPIQHINHFYIDDDVVTFCGIGANGEKIEYFSIVTGLVLNTLTLNYIINMLTSN